MFARICFVSPGSIEKYSWVIDTERESIDHWRQSHPEAESLKVVELDDHEGSEALYWQKCLYHDVFFERSGCRVARARGAEELREILELAGRLQEGRAEVLWERCMRFRFGSEPVAMGDYIHRRPT